MGWRKHLIGAGFNVLGATGLHRVAAPLTRGLGAILTFHHVRPSRTLAFAPNRMLEVTPDFLDAAILRLRQLHYELLSIEAAAQRLQEPAHRRGLFAVLTFDDGFRDNLEWALPVLERHAAPGAFYVPTGFPDRSARLWWVELEEAIRRADHVAVTIAGDRLDLPAATPAQKMAAFAAVYWRLRRGPETELLDVIGGLCAAEGVDAAALVRDLCLDWAEVATLAAHPLVTIGAHTVSHAMLAKHGEARVRDELTGGKIRLEQRLGRAVRHLAYPVGDRGSASAREFLLAGEAGYVSAVTTRPGLLFPAHREHPMALPRVSINGNHQTIGDLDILLSGAAVTLWNKGRRVVAD